MRVATRRVRAVPEGGQAGARPGRHRPDPRRRPGTGRHSRRDPGQRRDDPPAARGGRAARRPRHRSAGAPDHQAGHRTDRRPRPAGQRAGRPLLRPTAHRAGGGRRATTGGRPVGRPARAGRQGVVDAGQGAPQAAQDVREEPAERRAARAADLRQTRAVRGGTAATARDRSVPSWKRWRRSRRFSATTRTPVCWRTGSGNWSRSPATPGPGSPPGGSIQGCHERRTAARAAYPAAWKQAEAAGRKAFDD